MPTPTHTWRKRALYGLLFFFAFLFALQRTFPYRALEERLVLEAAAQGWHVQVDDIGPSGLVGLEATGVTLENTRVEGMKISLDELAASVGVLPALIGRKAVRFEAKLLDGRVKGELVASKQKEHVEARVEGLDLARAAALKAVSGLDLAGRLSADLNVTVDVKEPVKSDGYLKLNVEGAKVNGGSVPVPSMGGSVDVPKVDLGSVVADATIKEGEGKATVNKLEAKSPDVDVATEGLYFMVQPRIEWAPLFGKLKLKINDGFWSKSGTSGMRGMVEMAMANARAPNGYYTFQLYGTLLHPQARPLGR